ncbi:LL-diaminopimelate aminotransferase [Prosthecochloris sp. N3]|uniref:LL-diaminopimelate aminotransferase n=1 Tax=Prosthecochloris ethylica TaxID=2743976 RepID=A0ABR9XQ07_9CHLB|nr:MULTISPECIES: LL-diaminopimelate aminotransferase [Prosthecochloris]MBF0586169.1 LL-diaminopimelate aminotransferase [Prosthecochloris ethylica]MBF0635875.1 LL-diaminopimelate aminotransferase [Prosthecochloris ethylica]NUK47450.1 LL-diaminopimelate aminotransferase [Prosthecochloris ethylica]RNA64997.1 LL-diaminopimelate aminotransferase [Prosthecochloris sp. ZM_2]
MFDEIEFEKIKRLPKYVFAAVNELKMAERRRGEDVIDFSMGNPDGPTPQHIIDKLVESVNKPKTHGYSVSKGIYKLRLALCDWYRRTYGVELDPDTEVVASMGSKEGYVNLVQAITNPGDIAMVPDPCYPIHSQAFILAGGNVHRFRLEMDDEFRLDEEAFFRNIETAMRESSPRPKYLVVNFPNNPTTATVELPFYERLVETARRERFYIISDIAYAEITFDGYSAPSILQVPGAKDVAVESYTLSKTYNMAGWRVGFLVGNAKLVGALMRIKSWLDYGMFTPIQVASTVALNADQGCVQEIRQTYLKRREVLLSSFANAGWIIRRPRASMFVWAAIPERFREMGSLEFSKLLLKEAHVAVSPGIGFGPNGDGFVRIALIENEERIRQAARNIRRFFREYQG